MQIQQGDVIFESAVISPAAERVETTVFAAGEGHHVHRAAVPADVEIYQLDGISFVRVLRATPVEHVTLGGGPGEHQTITLPAGDYVFGQVDEYDYLAEMSRPVVD